MANSKNGKNSVNESKVKSENFYVVQGWMTSELKLKGNELNVYAIIFGFSQDEDQTFHGSLRYLMDWTLCSKQGIINILKSLIKKGYIKKKEYLNNGVKLCEYYATKTRNEKVNQGVVQNLHHLGEKSLPGVVKKVDRGGQKSLPGVVKKVDRGGQKSLPNKIEDNIDNNINNIYSSSVKKPIEGVSDNSLIKSKKSPSTKQLTDEFETIWNIYPNKKGKAKALELYIKARKNKTTFDEVFSGVKKYNEEIRIKRTELQFVKHGDTWFRNRAWKDEYVTNDILVNDSYNINNYEKSMDVFDAQVKEEERKKAKAEARAKVIELAEKEHEENVRKYDEKYAQELEECEDLEEYKSTKDYFNHLLAKGFLLDGTCPPEPKFPEYDLFENIENEEEYFTPP